MYLWIGVDVSNYWLQHSCNSVFKLVGYKTVIIIIIELIQKL